MDTYAAADSTASYFKFQKSKNATKGTNTAVTSGQVLGDIDWAGANGSGFGTGARISSNATETHSGTARGSELTFHTVDNTTTTLDERMVIAHNGKVGIGTTAPRTKLEIVQSSFGAGEGIRLAKTLSEYWDIAIGVDSGNKLYITNYSAGQVITMHNSAKVGIGTTPDLSLIHI